jgi:uncharacterized repeat protein (TIGR03803 family)
MKRFSSLLIALAFATLTLSPAVSAQAQTFSYFANFNSRNVGGSFMQATDGNFYTGAGPGEYGQGDILRVTPSGEFQVLYSFCSQSDCPDGRIPLTPILGSDGNLYGATEAGGNRFGGGTIYKMTLDGKLTTLYSFCITNFCQDGAGPYGLIQATDGNLYGETNSGGMDDSGTIFRVSPTGEFKVLHYFCSQASCLGSDAPTPSGLIQGIDGNLYGTTRFGGPHNGGALYRLTLAGEYTVIYNFCSLSNCLDGGGANQILQDSKGNFFGTTVGGGSKGYGTVFELTSSNQYIVLDSFNFVRGTPYSGLTLASDGNFYGTTSGAANYGTGGTVFKVTPKGKITFLNVFGNDCALDTGYFPDSSIFQGTDGTLYGATAYGTSVGDCDPFGSGYGTIYSVSGLSPLVETTPVAGLVGQTVLILGNSLTGTSKVTFNGKSADFTVESDTYIRATVPAGATTGIVKVTTPSGALKSNPPFVVLK